MIIYTGSGIKINIADSANLLIIIKDNEIKIEPSKDPEISLNDELPTKREMCENEVDDDDCDTEKTDVKWNSMTLEEKKKYLDDDLDAYRKNYDKNEIIISKLKCPGDRSKCNLLLEGLPKNAHYLDKDYFDFFSEAGTIYDIRIGIKPVAKGTGCIEYYEETSVDKALKMFENKYFKNRKIIME